MADSGYLRLVKSLTPEQVKLLDQVERAIRDDERELVLREQGIVEDDSASGWVPPAVKGEVGAIEGPPIVGTNDRVNSGVARRSRAVSGEVIEPGTTDATVTWPRWQPAGEVGIVIGADASVVENPKNDARPIERMTMAEHGPCDYNGGPGADQCPHGVFYEGATRLQRQLVEGYAIPEGWTAGRVGLCRSCKAPIMWTTTPKGMAASIDSDGTSHFATCPQADQWRRKP